MSYILDALKRADSEREREREDVPGLHSKTDVWVAPDEVRAAPSKSHAAVWALAVAGLVVSLGLLWFLLMRPTPAAPAPAAVVVTPPAVVLAPPAVTAVPPAVVAAPPAVVVPPVVIAPAPAPAPATPTASPTVTAAPKSKPPTPMLAAPAAAIAPKSVAAAASEPRVYTLSELPDEVRAGLPALVVGGAMYSQTPASRMLIVNGQLYREGDTVAPGLVLEQIKLKSAVLKVKGVRYGISY